MVNNKIIKVSIIVLVFFILVAILEISIKGVSNKVSEYSEQKAEEKKQEETYNSEDARNERQIADFAKIICGAINDRDYNYLWSAIDETYKLYKFDNNLENFKKYIDNLDFGNSHDVTKVNRSGSLYQVMIGVTSENYYSTKLITINAEEINSLKFMFDEIQYLEEMTGFTKYEDLKFNVNYFYKSSDLIAYVLDIENISSKDIKLDFINTSIMFFDGASSKGTKPESIVIKPNEIKRIEVYFKDTIYDVSNLQLEINKNGEKTNININFSDKFI